MKTPSEMTNVELVATILALRTRLEGPARGISRKLRASILARIAACEAALETRL